MDWKNSKTVKRWIVIGGVFVLALVFIACQAGSPAHAETPPAGTSFTAQADQLDEVTGAKIIGSVGTNKAGPCWGWDHTYPVTMNVAPHKTMYNFGVRVMWCANPARTKVTKLPTFECFDAGGYYDFDGCTKSKGDLGYASLGLSTAYHYHWFMGIPGVTDTRTPSIVFSVYPNGHVAGTVYFDN